MNMLRKLAVVVVALAGTSIAQADLITFETSGLMGCLGAGVQFAACQEDTGTNSDANKNRVPFSSLFTIDTSVAGEPLGTGGARFVGGAGTGISITFGTLTLFKENLVTEITRDAGPGPPGTLFGFSLVLVVVIFCFMNLQSPSALVDSPSRRLLR